MAEEGLAVGKAADRVGTAVEGLQIVARVRQRVAEAEDARVACKAAAAIGDHDYDKENLNRNMEYRRG